MNAASKQRSLVLFVLLALLMAATRYQHFGAAVYLPDASLAVFFLAGFYLANASVLPALLLLAGLLDYLAINVGGVSGWCFTPAYWFLIPTYASLWLGGRWYAARHRMRWPTLAPLGGALFVATSVAFVISNASFYALSGYFPQMAPAEFAAGVAGYYAPYLGWTLFYVAAGAVLHVALTAPRPLALKRTER